MLTPHSFDMLGGVVMTTPPRKHFLRATKYCKEIWIFRDALNALSAE